MGNAISRMCRIPKCHLFAFIFSNLKNYVQNDGTKCYGRSYMPAAKSHSLTLYRRHAGGCSQKKDALNCSCPLWVHGRVRGKFIRTSLSTRSIDAAQAKIRELLGDESASEPGKVVSILERRVTLAAAADQFYELKRARNRAAGTLRQYTSVLGRFLRFAGQRSILYPQELQTSAIENFFVERKLGARTRVVHLTILRVFLNFLLDRDLIARSPAAKRSLSFPAPKGNVRAPFLHEEIETILNAIRTDEERAVILTLLYSGMRISDTTYLERGAVSPNGILDYVVIKTRRPITIPPKLPAAAVQALARIDRGNGSFYFLEGEYPEAVDARRKGAELSTHFPAGFYRHQIYCVDKIITAVLDRARVKGTAHKFRDTFAINALTQGLSVHTVSKMLGHSDVRTTERYLHFVPGYREKMSAEVTYPLPHKLRKA